MAVRGVSGKGEMGGLRFPWRCLRAGLLNALRRLLQAGSVAPHNRSAENPANLAVIKYVEQCREFILTHGR